MNDVVLSICFVDINNNEDNEYQWLVFNTDCEAFSLLFYRAYISFCG
jgi:hypothetical protein